MLTIRPQPRASIPGSARRTKRTCTSTFIAKASSQSPSVVPSTSRPPAGPVTLFTSTSAPPKAASCARQTASTPASVARSAATASTRAPRPRSASAAAASAAAPRAQIVTAAPSAASASAIARPMPLLAPVTSARLPASPRSIVAATIARRAAGGRGFGDLAPAGQARYGARMPNRDTAALRAYHEATSHSVARLRQDPHWLDWEIMPRPFKVYPTLDPILLPRDITTARAATLDRAALARLLYFSAGVLRRRTYPGGEIFFRAAACTGALYHIDLYVACGPLADFDAGLYHFGPHDFALRRLRPGDHRAALVAASGEEPAVAGAPVVIAATSTFWRNAWKYRARAYRHAFWDTGTLLANLLAVAAAMDLPARVVVALGTGGPPPPPAPPVPPLGLEILPYSSREVAYPAIAAAHAASALATTAEVASWRAAVPPAPQAASPAPLVPLPVPAALPPEPIERVILRRGSARAFTHEPIALAELTALLHAASAEVPMDVRAPSTLYLVVNAVRGLDPGAYVYHPTRAGLERLRTGDFRRTAGHLGLDQDLAADAAVDLFWLVDLDAVLGRLGNRGYRAAELEAAIAGGRVYLAAYALGLGATGLTFFDDEVTAFFSPHAAGRSVMFLVAAGHPARAGRRG